MYDERINYNIRMTEIESQKSINKLKLDKNGRAQFRVNTYFNFINKRIPYDLMLGYYLIQLDGNRYKKIATASIPAMGDERINATSEGFFDTSEIKFEAPGKYALELYVCEQPEIGPEGEEKFNYRKDGYMVSSYFFDIDK